MVVLSRVLVLLNMVRLLLVSGCLVNILSC